jgi:hypothetical protein
MMTDAPLFPFIIEFGDTVCLSRVKRYPIGVKSVVVGAGEAGFPATHNSVVSGSKRLLSTTQPCSTRKKSLDSRKFFLDYDSYEDLHMHTVSSFPLGNK